MSNKQVVPDKKPIGLIIKDIMKEKDITASHLASVMGVHRQVIYDFQKKNILKMDTLERIATALGVESEEIIHRMSDDIIDNDDFKMNKKDSDNYLKMYIHELQETVRDLRSTVKSQAETILVLSGKSDSVFAARLAFIFFFEYGCKFGYTTIS